METIPLFIGGIGPTEMIVVLMIVVLLFGANKLPALARSSGEAMGEFKRGRDQIEQELADARDSVTGVEADEGEAEAVASTR
jgi:sec-independent protein translocase protein TatA